MPPDADHIVEESAGAGLSVASIVGAVLAFAAAAITLWRAPRRVAGVDTRDHDLDALDAEFEAMIDGGGIDNPVLEPSSPRA